MAPNIGESTKSVVEAAAEALKKIIAKLTGRSHDENDAPDDAEVAPAPKPMTVTTDAVSEPLEFERTDTDGTSKTLSFEPASEAHSADHPGTAE